jgi:hypothetical protein
MEKKTFFHLHVVLSEALDVVVDIPVFGVPVVVVPVASVPVVSVPVCPCEPKLIIIQ